MELKDLIVCPKCNGRCGGFAFINTGSDSSSHYRGFSECYLCDGYGRVPRSVLKALEDGKLVRQRRIEAGKSLVQLADELKLSISSVSSIETGRSWKNCNTCNGTGFDLVKVKEDPGCDDPCPKCTGTKKSSEYSELIKFVLLNKLPCTRCNDSGYDPELVPNESEGTNITDPQACIKCSDIYYSG